jgi:hypothetical protein
MAAACMHRATSRRAWLLLGLAAAVHGAALVAGWDRVAQAHHARDFASYYYAYRVAAAGLDPYDAAALDDAARADGSRRSVHPFLYPPPFLLAMTWTAPLGLERAYHAWYWLGSLFLLASLAALIRWCPGDAGVVASALVLATFSPALDGQRMGQANLPVLALLCWGALLAERGRPLTGGGLTGAGAVLKLGPVLWVAAWMVRRAHRAWLSAAATALALSLAALTLVNVDGQWAFYTRVLPSLGSGGYGGLSVPIGLFGNHSIANLWSQVWPGSGRLSVPARAATALCALLVITGALATARRGVRDGLDSLCALGVVCVAMVITPAYTFEHHLVFAVPAWIAVAVALRDGRLSPAWSVPLVPAYAAQAWPLASLRAAAGALPGPAAWLLQEAKCASLIVLGVAAAWTVWRPARAPTQHAPTQGGEGVAGGSRSRIGSTR